MLGLELLDNAAIAVALDEAGRVVARAQCRRNDDLQAAAFEALAGVPVSDPAGLAVAAIYPESPASAAAMKALAARFDGPFLNEPPIGSGAAAAAAEAWTGAARGAKDVVFFAIAEHTMGGILRDGVPLLGAHRRAAAVAWLALNPVEREDYRKIGCLETEVAFNGIVRRLIWRVKAGDASRVVEAAGGDLGAVTIDHVLDAARTGDGVSISVVRDTAKYVGMAAANLVLIADPEVLVLGGILASAADLLLDPVRTEIARRVPSFTLQALTIAPAALGADAPAIGAARIAAVALQ
jgi:predicted NBD/HSP70 family sugar kinase